MLAKKSLETGEDIDSIPESMRAYLAMQAMETGKGLSGGYLGRNGMGPFAAGTMLFGEQGAQGKVCKYISFSSFWFDATRTPWLTCFLFLVLVIHHLTCRSLSIGKWTRIGQSMMDLIVFYSPDKCTMTYYINNDQAGYKIEYPFSYIKNIYLENQEGDPTKQGGIVIELNRAPYFFMDTSTQASGFGQVGDFTEDSQASKCLIHHLGGNPKVLSGQLAKLISLDPFMNRHNPMAFADPHAVSASAPVSPVPRPSSQPNFAQNPPVLQEQQWGMNQMHSGSMRPPHGHKRQRSRSVPGPIDFAMFQSQPMPSFYIQPPGDMGPPQAPNVYAPIPQQPNALPQHLRIDTQAGFGLDMRQYPMSAATASPAEFPGSPGGFLPQGSDPTGMMTPNYNASYGGAFLSPMVNADGTLPTSVSPIPFNAIGEPSIVEQSPPMGLMARPGLAGMYAGQDGSCAVSEDGSALNEMYSKHSINLPMHTASPGSFIQSQHAELDMDQLVQFDTVDPASLSPEGLAPTQQ